MIMLTAISLCVPTRIYFNNEFCQKFKVLVLSFTFVLLLEQHPCSHYYILLTVQFKLCSSIIQLAIVKATGIPIASHTVK